MGFFSDRRRLKIGACVVGGCIILIAIVVPSVTQNSGQSDASAPPRPYSDKFTFEESSAEMRSVRRALKEVPLIDTHNDLPYQFYEQAGNHLDLLDLRDDLRGKTHTDIDRIRKGQLGGVFFVAYSNCRTQFKDAVEFGMQQVDLIHRLAREYPDRFEMAYTNDDVWSAHRKGKTATLIGVEGGHMIKSNLAILRMLYSVGVRYMTLTHNCPTPWAEAAYSDKRDPKVKHDDKVFEPLGSGLSDFGKRVILEMNRLGMMVDISHVSEESMLDALRYSRAPVIFSHSSARGPCNHRRNANDNVLRKLKENNGVIMINFWSKVIRCDENWMDADLDDVIGNIEHVKDLIGIDHVGIGADYDGLPYNQLPIGLEDVSRYPNLFARILQRPGWTIDDVKKVAGLNILRVMKDVERVKGEMADEKPDDETLLYDDTVNKFNATGCKTIRDHSKQPEYKSEEK